jgi:hypothetical protein
MRTHTSIATACVSGGAGGGKAVGPHVAAEYVFHIGKRLFFHSVGARVLRSVVDGCGCLARDCAGLVMCAGGLLSAVIGCFGPLMLRGFCSHVDHTVAKHAKACGEVLTLL